MATYTVATQSQLDSALRNVSAGDTIQLQSGSYDLKMMSSRQTDFDFARTVTITSANANRPAEIKQMYLREVENVKISNLVMDFERGGSVSKPLERTKKFFVESSADVTFDSVKFEGEMRNGYGSGLGLRMKNSSDIAVLDSEFVNLENGINMSHMTNVTLSGNTLRGISNDAMSFGGMVGMRIEDNVFRDFHSNPNQKHRDAIQFRTAGSEAPSRDVIITKNVIDNPEDAHGIYFGNSLYSRGDKGAYYRNITITDNDLNVAHKLAIAIQHGDGLSIRGNTVTHNKADGLTKQVNLPLINISLESRNVSIVGNEVAAVQKAQNGTWTVSGNDTKNIKVLFWDGLPGGSSAATAALSTLAASAERAFAAADDADGGREFRVKAENARLNSDDGLSLKVEFDKGDHFVFNRFADETFRDKPGGNPVHDFFDGSGVRIDSVLDLRELVAFSPALEAKVEKGALVLTIDHGADMAKVTFEGLGQAYLDAAKFDHLF